jgi:septum formation protein
LAFDIEAIAIDEELFVDPDERDPSVIVERIARAKFAAFPVGSDRRLLLTADTLVACDGSILGKPASRDHLVSMLGHMSGRPLVIATAVCVGDRGAAPAVGLVTTTVELRTLTAADIESYVATGAGMDKAGGLALQSEASLFIQLVRGCWSNVVGLPLCAASQLLRPALGYAEPAHTDLGSSVRRSAMGDVRCSAELCGRHDW